MLKTILNFFLLTSCILFFSHFSSEEENIKWNQNRPLTWEDFKGKPKQNSPYYAMTFSGISISSQYLNNNLEVQIHCTFSPQASWVKKDKATEQLLQHEQMHFNITELHARKMRKAIDKLSIEDPQEKMKAVEKLFNEIYQENSLMQAQYDKESNHSINSPKQLYWNKTILLELKKLNNYAVQ